MAMKQRITLEQLNELDEEQLTRLRDWWKPEEGDWYFHPRFRDIYVLAINGFEGTEELKTTYSPLLSIGQYIELLEEKRGWEWIKALVAPTYGATIDLYYEEVI
jgi:hypothetical protein